MTHALVGVAPNISEAPSSLEDLCVPYPRHNCRDQLNVVPGDGLSKSLYCNRYIYHEDYFYRHETSVNNIWWYPFSHCATHTTKSASDSKNFVPTTGLNSLRSPVRQKYIAQNNSVSRASLLVARGTRIGLGAPDPFAFRLGKDLAARRVATKEYSTTV